MKRALKTLALAVLAAPMLMAAGGAGAAEIRERTLKFSHVQPKDSHMVVGVQHFADLVA